MAVKRDSAGSLSVQDVECARVYHVNAVMEIRTQVTSFPAFCRWMSVVHVVHSSILQDQGHCI